MSWDDEVNEMRAREALAFAMGGPDKVARQHEFNKLTIRERIDAISDADSFHEVGTLAGVGEYDDEGELQSFTPSNFVFGTADVVERYDAKWHSTMRNDQRLACSGKLLEVLAGRATGKRIGVEYSATSLHWTAPLNAELVDVEP